MTTDTLNPTAPDEQILGKSLGYPIGHARNYFSDESLAVGSFSNMDKIHPMRVTAASGSPSALRRGEIAPEFRYRMPIITPQAINFGEETFSIDDYLRRQRITGLMIIKDGEVLLERYQYDRGPEHRFASFSIAKSVTSLAVGCALHEGRIRSLDDKISDYVTELAGTAYGETSIRHVLRMSSGVRFSEDYSGSDDFFRFLGTSAERGLIEALRMFNDREAEPGTRFSYATSETYLAGLAVARATGVSLADYVSEKIWKPMGAEADGKWQIDPTGNEYSGSGFNAVLRDYGRLGMLLANDGMRDGVQILPKDYLLEATDWRRQPPAFHPLRATPGFGYGYQFWLMRGEYRRFGMLGVRGQAIYVDPATKLVLAQTAAAKNADFFNKENLGLELAGVWLGLLAHFARQ